ncbi:MAG TPA: hypothetical protein VMG36_04535, partial [Thermoplasmata archaeon]|nr:hypothetical protein [Thermoplasmata archaeon]
MAVGGLVGLLLLILLVVAVATVVLAFRHRLGFRLAMRNVRRGRGRTILLIAGLLVATTIVSSSLVVGSTVEQLAYHYTYLGAGYVDEAISAPAAAGGSGFFPYSTYTNVVALVGGHPSIAGLTPMVIATSAVLDTTSGIPDTNLNLIGANASQSAALGQFVAQNGTTLPGPGAGQAYIDEQTASALNASTGDSLVVYGATHVALRLAAIVQPNVRGAFITAGLSPGNVFV